ncbi:MAG: class I SAM-dependent methyltransferase [Proteobacteria bacterium]|nr:class I SAM-dependent methyltransferase [Pseudomonadota bacterium]
MGLGALAIQWAERGQLPDALVRSGIRQIVRSRRRSLLQAQRRAAGNATRAFGQRMRAEPIAVLTAVANAQHYELPADFFALVLGPQRKYSCGWWPEGVRTLEAAERAALEATCARAGLVDGQRILELGCGWGSLTLWMAERAPRSKIIAVSNSHSQREYILEQAARRSLHNIDVRVADMNRFEFPSGLDRVVSVEMFEHMRNWPALVQRVSQALVPGGQFFMHVFCHREVPYFYEDEDSSDWMSRHFFSGGIMPSDALPAECQDHLSLRQQWRWDGTHYQRTARAWLDNLDRQRERALEILSATYGAAGAELWLQRWRMFFMACEELFGHRAGQEWWVTHSLFERSA